MDNVQSKLLKEHIRTTETYKTGTTIVAVVTADLIARMRLIGSYLEMIHRSVMAERLDLNYVTLVRDHPIG